MLLSDGIVPGQDRQTKGWGHNQVAKCEVSCYVLLKKKKKKKV